MAHSCLHGLVWLNSKQFFITLVYVAPRRVQVEGAHWQHISTVYKTSQQREEVEGAAAEQSSPHNRWRHVKESQRLQTKIALISIYNSNQFLLKRADNSNWLTQNLWTKRIWHGHWMKDRNVTLRRETELLFCVLFERFYNFRNRKSLGART